MLGSQCELCICTYKCFRFFNEANRKSSARNPEFNKPVETGTPPHKVGYDHSYICLVVWQG